MNFDEKLYKAIRDGDVYSIGRILSKKPISFDWISSTGENALAIAAECKNMQIVQMLMAASIYTRGAHMPGGPALCKAVELGYGEVAGYLLNMGVSVYAADTIGNTPMIYAASSGNFALIKTLAAMGADINHRANSGTYAIIAAAYNGHSDIVRHLIAVGANVNVFNNHGVTPLHWAAEKGYKNITEVLIISGADINVCNNEKNTPLHLAAQQAHVNIATVLIRAGAGVDTLNMDGKSPLQLFKSSSDKKAISALINELVEAKDPRVPDLICKFKKSMKKADYLALVDGVYFDAFCTRLRSDSPGNRREAVLMLGELGTDRSASALTAFMEDAGKDARSSVQTDLGNMLISAARQCDLNAVNWLLKVGVDVNWKNSQGMTAVNAASERGYGKIVHLLVVNGAEQPYAQFSLTTQSGNSAEPEYSQADLAALLQVNAWSLQHTAQASTGSICCPICGKELPSLLIHLSCGVCSARYCTDHLPQLKRKPQCLRCGATNRSWA